MCLMIFLSIESFFNFMCILNFGENYLELLNCVKRKKTFLTILFPTFLKSVYDICLTCQPFVCLRPTLILKNVLGLPCNLYMLIMFSMACSLLKIMCVSFIAHLQGHSQEFRYIMVHK